jgi:CIC family chloride channel protein
MDEFTKESENLSKLMMALLSVIIGSLSGLSIGIFRRLTAFIHNLLFLGKFSFIYKENFPTPVSPWGIGVIILPIIGAPIVIWLIEHFAHNEKGLSVPEIMYSIHCKEGRIPPKVSLAKTLASSISIGTGGSIGLEGPIVQLGSAVSSLVSDLIKMPVQQRFVLVAAGAAASTAAMFNAPMTGIVFVFELMLISLNFFNITLLILATYVAAILENYVFGPSVFFTIPNLVINNSSIFFRDLLLFIPIGILIGLSSVIFIHGIYWFEDLFTYLFKNPYLRHIVGMSFIGVMLYLFMYYFGHYYIEGIGYSTIQDILLFVIKNPLLLFLLFLGKLLATCLTLSSGASGGVFSPSLFLGAVWGGFLAIISNLFLPNLSINPTFFIIVSMAGMLGSITGMVITSIVLLFEVTGAYQVIFPTIITAITAYWVRKAVCSESVYTLKLNRRGINYRNCGS